MTLPAHPAWGRPLMECIADCNLTGSISVVVERPVLEELRVAIEQIGVGEHVSNEMLKKLLCYSAAPAMTEMLGHPPLTKGCLTIACEPMIDSGKKSPFSYERGYLALRLFSLSLGMDLFRRFQPTLFEDVTRQFLGHFNDSYLTSPDLIAGVLRDLARSEATCDSIVGWSRAQAGSPPPALQYSDALALLELLYDDREALLAAGCTRQLAPGFEPIVFLVWRCAGQGNITRRAQAQAYEVLNRFGLTIPADNRHLFFEILSASMDEIFGAWTEEPAVDYSPEDALAIVNSYIYRVSPEGYPQEDPNIGYSLCLMLFATRAVKLVPHELIPNITRATLRHAWEALDIDKGEWMGRAYAFGRMMWNLRHFQGSLQRFAIEFSKLANTNKKNDKQYFSYNTTRSSCIVS